MGCSQSSAQCCNPTCRLTRHTACTTMQRLGSYIRRRRSPSNRTRACTLTATALADQGSVLPLVAPAAASLLMTSPVPTPCCPAALGARLPAHDARACVRVHGRATHTACVRTCVCACEGACVRVCVCVFACLYACVFACLCACVRACVHLCIDSCMNACVRARACACAKRSPAPAGPCASPQRPAAAARAPPRWPPQTRPGRRQCEPGTSSLAGGHAQEQKSGVAGGAQETHSEYADGIRTCGHLGLPRG